MRISTRSRRSGAVLAEAAIVIPVFLLLVLAAIDLGSAVYRYNQLSQAARTGARTAIVHGEYCKTSWNGGPWGPTAVDLPISTTGDNVVDAVKPSLVGCPTTSRVQVTWLDGNNKVESRIRVTVTSTYTPLFTWILGSTPINLSAASTMMIAH